MEHFYLQTNSESWFSFPNFYSYIVNKFPDNSTFVEVGAWKGRSACYMAVEIINSGKNIDFYCVDTWEYVETSSEIGKDEFNNLFEIFQENIKPVSSHIKTIKSLSWDGAKHFEDNSVDFVFIDAAHDYESVMKDIQAWYPKVKQGGIISGHDYRVGNGVYEAVNEFFKEATILKGEWDCWYINK